MNAAAPAASGRLTGTITILLTLASWTSIPLFLRSFKDDIDGWTANGWRYGFSALLWLPVLLIGLRKRDLPAGLWRAALWPSIFNTAAQVAFGLAPYFIDPGLMAFSLRLQIVFVTIGAALLFPAERRIIRAPGFIVGIALVIIGTLITIMLPPAAPAAGPTVPVSAAATALHTAPSRNVPLGVSLAIASGLLYAAYGLAVRKSMHGMSPLTAFAAVSQYTAAAMVLLMVCFGANFGLHLWDLPAGKIKWVLISAVIGIGIGHTLYFYSMKKLGLAVSAGVVQLQPITVSICAPFLFPADPHLSIWQWLSGGCAVLGAATMLITQHRLAGATPAAAPDELDDLPVDPDVALVAQANEPAGRASHPAATEPRSRPGA